MTEAAADLQIESKTAVSGANAIPEDLSRNARSEVLLSQDILELILSFFDPEAFWGDGIWDMDSSTRSALYLACLTSTSFVTPASGLLWRMMTSLVPVFKILPTFTKVNDVYTVDGAIQASHLDRLAAYSCKVRYLYLQSFQDAIAGHVISRLLVQKNFTLFPALRTLYIPYLQPPTFRSIDNLNPLFLVHGLSLTTLSLGGINSTTEVFAASLLSALSQRTTAVQDIVLSGRLSLEILSFIPSFTRLQGLNVTFDSRSVVPSIFVYYCGALPDLTHLIMNLNNSTIDNPSMLARGSIQGFECVEELRLTGDPAETSKILGLVDHARSLKTIVLACTSLPSNPAPVSLSLSGCIQDCARIAPSLQVLRANMGNGKAIVLPVGVLRPLIQCRDLTHLEITGVSIPINDDHISELCAGNNWRNLRILSLPHSIDGNSPSLASLHILAHCCPELLNLTFPVDLRLQTPVTLQNERLHNPRGSNVIERLTIHKITTSPFDNDNNVMMAIAVSRFIEYCFPCLKGIKLNSDAVLPDAEWWRTVKTMMTEFRAVRHEAVSNSSRSPSP